MVNENIGEEAEKYVLEYNNYVEELLGTAFSHDVKAASILGSLAHIQFSSDDIDSNYGYEKEEIVGTHTETHIETRTEYEKETKSKKVKKSGLGAKFCRFIGRFVGNDELGYEYENYTVDVPVQRQYAVDEEVDDRETRHYINFAGFFEGNFLPYFDSITTRAREVALEIAKEEETKLKESFMDSFDELTHKIQRKLEEQKNTLYEKEQFEAMIEQNEKNIKWITDFKQHLNEALSN